MWRKILQLRIIKGEKGFVWGATSDYSYIARTMG